MTETQTAPTLQEQETEPIQGRQEITIPQGRLGNNFFDLPTPEEEKPVNNQTEQNQEQKPEPPKPTETKSEEVKPEQSTIVEWYKDYGWENLDVAKAEISKLKEHKPQEIKFENEESKKVHQLLAEGKIDEVLDIYSKQKSIEKVISAEVNKDTAADIIKLNMQLKYPTLTKDQIDFQFRQEYGLPKEPVQKDTEDEADFNERHQNWKDQVANIEMKTSIAATMAKPELEAAKQKLVLPDIFKQPENQKPPTQEELEAAKKFDDAFIQSVDSTIKDFNGFSVKVKNEAVGLAETAIDYLIPDAEKQLLANEMKGFVEQGYDANSIFAQRWVNTDKTLNTKLMSEDRYWLTNRDKILQKVANDSATKAIDTYLKGKKNIDINETNQPGTATINKEDKTEMDTVRDQFFG